MKGKKEGRDEFENDISVGFRFYGKGYWNEPMFTRIIKDGVRIYRVQGIRGNYIRDRGRVRVRVKVRVKIRVRAR